MTDIYTQHDKAFASVSAYVICKDGKQVGNIAFKFPRDGAGRLWCYVHVHGLPMVRGYAGGYGYDKKTAAASAAAKQIPVDDTNADCFDSAAAIRSALRKDNGYDWDWHLRDRGFDVFGAV